MKCSHEKSVDTRDGKECAKCFMSWRFCLREKRDRKRIADALNQRAEVSRLVRRWKKKHKEFSEYSLATGDSLSSNRYNGIATGMRWCFEDLEKIIK